MKQWYRQNSRSGFTLIEIIAVILVIGILAAVAISRAFSTAEFDLSAEANILKSNLRHAQLRAMGDTAAWGITLAAGSYTLKRDNNGDGDIADAGDTSPYNLPNEENGAIRAIQSGVTITPPDPATVTFDIWGSPGAANITITMSKSGVSENITITRNTGFIP